MIFCVFCSFLLNLYTNDITEENVEATLKGYDGVLIAPGFGERGIEGKIISARYTRENNIPTLGICYGMQVMAIEFARNVLGYKDAHTVEINPNATHKVIDLMEEQKTHLDKGGSMRLGAYETVLNEQSLAYRIYGTKNISERHRHRYEVNIKYKEMLSKAGMEISGLSPDGGLPEIVEIPNHPWFIGVQFHPEFYCGKDDDDHSTAIFTAFVNACR